MMTGARRWCHHAHRGGAVTVEVNGIENVVPLSDSGVIGGAGEEKKGEEEEVGGDDGGGDGDYGGVGGSGFGDGASSGVGGGDDGSDGDGGETVAEEVVEEVLEEIVVEVVVEEGVGEETRVVEILVVETTVVVKSGEPKGKGITTGEPTITQGPVITSLDYAESALQEDVMNRERENPGLLDAILTAVRETREAELAWA